MAAPDVVLNRLQTLPPRPPTPPRETVCNPSSQTTHLLVCQPSGSRLNIQTPPNNFTSESPSSSNGRKKVGFSAQTEYKDPPVYTEGNAGKLHPTPVSLPRSASKPVKSILKVTSGPNPLDSSPGTPFDPSRANANLSAMLDSTIQQLAGADRESRLDAYMMLMQALKASNNLPDRVALQEKMSLFMQFMQRDITSKTSTGAIDSSLVNHSLNLLVTFFNFPAIASTLSSDFGVFIIDHCIRSFEDPSIPKDIIRRLMQVVAVQNFPPKVMTSDRVARLVSSLRKIEEHLTGKSIIMSRVLIYRKLVKQSKQHMVVHSDWLFDLFTDMLSGMKDIRSAAISLGLEAAFSIGKEKMLSRKVMEMLNLTFEETTYVEYYEERLQAMSKDNADSASVPQIWSVVMLLLRCPFEKWDLFSRWLHIIQTCFNRSDFQTKNEANLAWSRLVYLVHLEDRSFPKMISTLSQPLASQLKRKGTTRHLRRTVIGGICNLFYYAFRPTTNLTLLDGYWDNCVQPLVRQLLELKVDSASDGFSQASEILCGLFDCTTPRVWKEDRVTDTALVKPQELPAIDSKWVRRNAGRVFGILEPILERDMSAVADTTTVTHKLWRALVGTVASAAAKEIKVSIDTANFVAYALNVLQKVWRRGPKPADETDGSARFLKGVLAYLETMTELLGLLPFTEKLLSTDKQNHFVAITTPTHRPGKAQGMAKAPILHLFSILSTLPPHVQDDAQLANFFVSAFTPFLTSKSDKGQMDLAQDLLSSLPMEAMSPFGPWLLAAERTSVWLETGHNSVQASASTSGNETPVGHDYRGVVRVLERGLRSTPNLPWEYWRSLFSSLHLRCREETGDAGVAIAAIEPLAKVLVDLWTAKEPDEPLFPAIALKCTAELLSIATQPRDRQAVDAARRRLWGTVVAGARSSSFDTFDHLYKLANMALSYLYQTGGPADAGESVVSLLKEIGGFFDRSNPQLVLKSLLNLQPSLSLWVRDCQADTRRQPIDVVETVKSLWEKITGIIATSEEGLKSQLNALEPLLCAAFESKHRHIVNSTLSLWNSAFDHTEELEYPETLKATVIALRPFVDIVLPGLEDSSIESGGRAPFFVESQDEMPLLSVTPAKPGRPTSRPTSSSRRSGSPSVRFSAASAAAVAAERDADSTPRPKSADQRTTTPRLRHDDSQLQFAAIESSPIGEQFVESQVLTERQREVRERQKENAALFPEIWSSPAKLPALPRSSSRPTSRGSPKNKRAETPNRDGTFEDYVTSTPTPRRGQPLPMADQDHDMTDPPSSPPEPRRNPLAAEIQSWSASSSLMDEWQFSSSPISGSPNPNRQTSAPGEDSQEDDPMDDCQPLDGDDDHELGHAEDAMDRTEAELPTSTAEDVIEDSILEQPRKAISLGTSDATAGDLPSTPPQFFQALPQRETPKSENEVFVDARASPLPATPRRSQRTTRSSQPIRSSQRLAEVRHDQSLELSELDESSILRLVVELDSGRLDKSGYRQLTNSPDKKAVETEDALDCIVVGDSSAANSPEKATTDRDASQPLASPVKNSQAIEQMARTSSQSRPGSEKKKRGRRTWKSQGKDKKRKWQEAEAEEASPALVIGDERSESGDGIKLRNGRVAKKKRPSLDTGKGQPRGAEIPSSSPEPPSQDAAAVQDVKMRDANVQESEENELQSQLEMEVEARSVREQTSESHIETSSAVQTESAGKGKEKEIPTEVVAAGEQLQASEAAQDGGIFSKIMTTLQGGLNALRTAKLSREEVYKVEDIFMDMKRELFEAERRGRAEGST